MPIFGKGDIAAHMPKWIGALVKKKSTANTIAAMFGNTTPGETGVFTVDTKEARANPGIAHAGIITRKVGTGGRAGRVQTEVLVAGGTFGAVDANDDAAIPDALVTIPSTQPVNRSVTGPASSSFTLAPTVKPAGVAMTYQWQSAASGSNTFANVVDGGVYSGATTATVNISNTTGLNGMKFRCIVTPVGGVAKTSRAGTLTVA